VQATTESAPASPLDGVDIAILYGGGVGSVVPVLRAPAGQTFTGTGTVKGYLYVPALARWVRAPRADDDLADANGLNEIALPALPISWTDGRFALVYDSVGLSGGTDPEVDLLACGRMGEAL